MACICPFMACGTALGGLFFLGVRFGSILCVTPFLVLAIGVDDAYLMIHSWQRVTKELRENPVKGDSAAYRLAQVLSDTGPAIMISALTNISADAKSISSLRDRFTDGFNGLLDKYVSMITNQLFDVFIVIVWLIFLATSIKGITQMPINLTPKKLFSLDSSLQEMDVLRVNYVIPHFTLATLFVNKPGNLSDPSRLARLNQFVNEMESLPGAWGSKSSNYFIRDFVEFEKGMSEMEAEEEDAVVTRDPNVLNFNDLPSFLEWPEYEYWRGFVRFSTGNETKLERFFLTTAFYGEELKEWINRDIMLKRWREVVDRYAPEFNITVFYDDAIYLDLIENMPTDTWQSGVATLCCMAVVCFIFMFDIYTVVITTGVIASIMTGILGTLSWTGTELDPIVMAALIISIGFSVDIPAHVSYHYYSAGM
ncbi:unnamed protein product [Nippostrongylus brasiliensis]|uniref:SSD domain-containing protein n=1 Tax=Nippostrongylus brasiliensis TaxID=27835 RepID=A0A0N4YR33_NIPBR|nr:unnamed protein product [Nippostrongylus brasiliensis]